jgi:hypothetical protein
MKNKINILFLLVVTAVAVFAATRYPVYSSANAPLLIVTGQGVSTADGTVTNTFSTTFGAVPKVIPSIFAANSAKTTNLVLSVTTSNFVWACGANGVTNPYIAIGVQ